MWRPDFRPSVRTGESVSHERCAIMCKTDLLSFFEELGPLKLKNIARPVEAFAVNAGHAQCPSVVHHQCHLPRRRYAIVRQRTAHGWHTLSLGMNLTYSSASSSSGVPSGGTCCLGRQTLRRAHRKAQPICLRSCI
jgi:hypothetical protein